MKQQSVLIIGANSAVALAVSAQLAPANKLYFLGRDPEKLRLNLDTMNLSDSWYACADANDLNHTSERIEQAWKAAKGFDLVFVAIGLLGEQKPTEYDAHQAQRVLSTNFNAIVAILITVSCLMERQGRGKIAVISSVAGERGRPRNYTYGAAKAGLSCYLQGLRSRLWRRGIEVYTFKLGPVDTPMTATHARNFSFSSTEKVARRMIRLLAGKRYSAYVPGFWLPVMWVVRWLPEPLFQRLHFLSGR